MGFGCIRVDHGRCTAIDFGVVTTKAGEKFGNRLKHIAEDLRSLIRALKPSMIAMEKLYFTSNAQTAMRVAEARGVASLIAAEEGIPVVEFTPSQIKKALTGDGRADKRAMQRMTALLLELSRIPKPDDAADALAVAITAASVR
jgi:crossover junction endodeoxyribonuclease RuvC